MKTIRVGSVQFEHVNGNKEANFSIIETFVRQAVDNQVEMVIFPECCITGYWFLRNLSRVELEGLAEPVFEGGSSQRLGRLAADYGIGIGAGLIEMGQDGRMYNTYVVATADGKMYRHRKIHCFISEHVDSGDEFTVFDGPGGFRYGVLTCYDNNLGENVRINALKGAEILLAPHQTGGCRTGSPYSMGLVDKELWANRHKDRQAIEAELSGPKGREWIMTWLPARAFDNGLFIVFSNGIGVDDNEIRTGNAMILDPYGRVVAETCRACDWMVVADLEGELRDKCPGLRRLKARRCELYEPLVTPTGLEEDMRKVRFGDIEQ